MRCRPACQSRRAQNHRGRVSPRRSADIADCRHVTIMTSHGHARYGPDSAAMRRLSLNQRLDCARSCNARTECDIHGWVQQVSGCADRRAVGSCTAFRSNQKQGWLQTPGVGARNLAARPAGGFCRVHTRRRAYPRFETAYVTIASFEQSWHMMARLSRRLGARPTYFQRREPASSSGIGPIRRQHRERARDATECHQ